MAPNSTCDDCGTDKDSVLVHRAEASVWNRKREVCSQYGLFCPNRAIPAVPSTQTFLRPMDVTPRLIVPNVTAKMQSSLGEAILCTGVQYGVEATARERALQVVRNQLTLVEKMWEGDANTIKAAERNLSLRLNEIRLCGVLRVKWSISRPSSTGKGVGERLYIGAGGRNKHV